MSRYTGPRVRAMRALGVQLPGLSVKPIEKRPFPPGQHGQARRKFSEYGLRLIEKQKLCRNYGVTEGQMRRLMKEALAAKGPTGQRLLELLECRLDNVVFRAGFARTIPAARQLVNHGHVTVDGEALPWSRLPMLHLCRFRSRSSSWSNSTRSGSDPSGARAILQRVESRE